MLPASILRIINVVIIFCYMYITIQSENIALEVTDKLSTNSTLQFSDMLIDEWEQTSFIQLYVGDSDSEYGLNGEPLFNRTLNVANEDCYTDASDYRESSVP